MSYHYVCSTHHPTLKNPELLRVCVVRGNLSTYPWLDRSSRYTSAFSSKPLGGGRLIEHWVVSCDSERMSLFVLSQSQLPLPKYSHQTSFLRFRGDSITTKAFIKISLLGTRSGLLL